MGEKDTEKYRLFIAIELPNEVKNRLAILQNDLDRVRKVPIDQMHLTLRFLGDIEKDQIPLLSKEMQDITLNMFTLTIKGVGFFPNKYRPKVVWAGIDGNKHLRELYDKIENTIINFGLEPENRSFKPHITLGRINYSKKLNTDTFLEQYAEFEISDIQVRDFILFRSVLSKKGAKHIPLERFQLA